MQIIPVYDLVFVDEFISDYPVQIELVYAQPDHADNHFGAIYDAGARLIMHRDLALVVLRAAQILNQAQGWRLVIKDCLRTTNAQAAMAETDIVKANPHWLVEPRFLSQAGQGGHPRGMAVDVGAIDKNGVEIDFGTRFDYFSSSTDVSVNFAHRNFAGHSDDVNKHRKILEEAMVNAAAEFDLPLLPLPHEWWDFRFPSDYTARFAPLSDDELPDGHRVTKPNKIKVKTDARAVTYITDRLRRFGI